MIERLWIQPPLAFARLGPSPVPCDNHRYGPSDLTPRGTGRTTVLPDATLDLAEDGTLTERMPERVQFKDEAGWRPVCPYFELHGAWTVGGVAGTGPVTEQVLADCGLSLADVRWEVRVANLKAHHITQQAGDRIEARVDLAGDDHRRRVLEGRSPQAAQQPLVPAGEVLPLGSVQVPAPNPDLPELRLRFTPAAGVVYGPRGHDPLTGYELPQERLFLNPEAAWSGFRLTDTDYRTTPALLFAGAERGWRSLGLVDDVCDGTVTVSLPDGPRATARIVSAPPRFSPDRRPFVSLADGLADRVQRADVHDPAYVEDEEQTALEVRDLFERVLETMGAINVDVQNERAARTNAVIAAGSGLSAQDARSLAFDPPEPLLGLLLGLTERGRRRHRRFVALEVLEDMVREQPDLIGQQVRAPAAVDAPGPVTLDSPRFYTRQMPSAMRGSDAYPMHLTRRQYDLLVRWAEKLREDTEPDS
ncbi:hypothetical protein AVW11_29685 [Streptomyces amritsarensis]|uniref:Uncharacterized protein n=1 Tax=Streptomyces amritsarensis TaxID=681158 RepID=A0ABX3FUL6_9ACTN|nr:MULTISPECIES: hypothetical protein [Streptomyces]OLZ56764.1 hypothetical protein AVW11_29685 [Streptomyces amritsarensis]